MYTRIFYLTATELRVYHQDPGHIIHDCSFPTTEEGLVQLFRYIEHERNIPSYLLLDLVEEEFRTDTVPRVRGSDQVALLERRLKQLFRNTPYRAASVQGRATGNEKTMDEALFCAITNTENLSLVLSWLHRYKVPLAGIYTTATISGALIQALHIDYPRLLLLSKQSNGMIRQSYLLNGQLKVSRMSQAATDETAGYSKLIASEVQKSRRYLQRLHVLQHDQDMDVCILCDQYSLAELRAGCQDSANIRYHFIDVHQAIRALGVDVELRDNQAEQLYAQALFKTRPAINYARDEERRHYKGWWLNRAIAAGAFFVALGSACWGTFNLIEAHRLERAQAALLPVHEDMVRRHAHEHAKLPKLPVTGRQVQDIVGLAGALASERPDPLHTLSVVGRQLDQHPRIHLDSIQWTQSSSRATDQTQESAGLEDTEEGYTNEDLADVETAATADRAHSVVLKGRVLGFDGDLHAAYAVVDRFVNELRAAPHVQDVLTTRMPIDVGSEATLVLDSEARKKGQAAAFEISARVKERQ